MSNCNCAGDQGTVDMTMLIYQSVTDWLGYVKDKHGEKIAGNCRNLIGENNKRKMVNELDKTPTQMINSALSLGDL